MDDRLRHPLMRWLVYGHVWVALAVVAQTIWTIRFLPQGDVLLRYAWAAGLGSFAAYGVMRIARARAPEHDRFANLSWYAGNRTLTIMLVALASIGAVVLAWPFRNALWPLLLPVVLLAFFYVTPFTSRKGTGYGLRSVPLLKAFLIAGLWVVVTVAIPLRIDPEGHSVQSIVAMSCMRFPFILALAIVFDIRDLATDPPALRTVPQLIGVGGARTMAIVLLLLSGIFEAIFLHQLQRTGAMIALLLAYVTTIVLCLLAPARRDAFHYGFLIDGTMILVPLAVLIGDRLQP
ncbi:MAG TPA: hypothetical protein VGE21_14230 [Flavobacteriales bacterium]